jgi:selenocysteine lyase/cysteine desulfurase
MTTIVGTASDAGNSDATLDDLRATEYDYLDRDGHVYLDYTGAGLPARAQLHAHAQRILSGCYGNPHSDSPTSRASTELVEQARAAVLTHFGASPDEYAVIFSANATNAVRLVGEAYAWRGRVRDDAEGSQPVDPADTHTIDEYLTLLGLPSAGAIRVSLGIASNSADVERFLKFAATYRGRYPDPSGLSPRLTC